MQKYGRKGKDIPCKEWECQGASDGNEFRVVTESKKAYGAGREQAGRGGRRGAEIAHVLSCRAMWAQVWTLDFIPNAMGSIKMLGAENELTGLCMY